MFYLASALELDHPAVQEKIGKADVIVYQRNVMFPDVWKTMDYWRALGKIVLVDLDDGYSIIPPSNPAFPFWMQNVNQMDPVPVERLRTGLKHADALIAPSQVLLDDWAKDVPGYLWPNYPAEETYVNVSQKPVGAADMVCDYDVTDPKSPVFKAAKRTDSEGQIIIGWGGSISHVDSFYYSGIVEALKKLMDENPLVVLKFCGHESRLDFLWETLPKPQFIRHGGVAPEDWPQVVSTFDIGIAPLDMRPVEDGTGAGNGGFAYDERRSWLKLVEYVCAGVPFVATNAAPYRELGRFGKLVENTPKAWYEALKSRIDGLAHYKAEAWKGREWAMKHLTQEANAGRLMALYERIGLETQSKRGARLPDAIYL